MTTATYTVQVAWEQQLLNNFTLDKSELDGTDVLSAVFGSTVYDDITSDVKSVSITRGRPSDLVNMNAGICNLVLKDSTGLYNPQNPSSSLAGTLLPMRPARVSAVYGGTTYYLFTGYITRIEHNPDPARQETSIECSDFFEWLNYAKPTISTQTGQRVDQLIVQILNAIGWVDPAQMNIDTDTDVVPTWSDADGTKSCLALIQNLLATDLGVFFIDAQGRPTYLSRHRFQTAQTVAATFDGTQITGLLGSTDVRLIVNRQDVTRTGGTLQTAQDGASQSNYGFRDGSPINTPNLPDDDTALLLAQYLVFAYKDPRPPLQSVQLVNRDSTELNNQLFLELGNYVTVNEATRSGTDVSGNIWAINHAITDAGLVHRTNYVVQASIMADAFILDTSTLDGTDVLSY